MLFESHGLGTQRYDVVSTPGAPDAIVHVRTRLMEEVAVQAYLKELLPELLALWKTPPVLRMQTWGDQTSEGLYMVVLGVDYITDTQFASRALDTYRTILAKHRLPGAQPPLSHDVVFLPSGHTVHYAGRD